MKSIITLGLGLIAGLLMRPSKHNGTRLRKTKRLKYRSRTGTNPQSPSTALLREYLDEMKAIRLLIEREPVEPVEPMKEVETIFQQGVEFDLPPNNPSSLDPGMVNKEEEAKHGFKVGDSTIGFPIYNGRTPSITIQLEMRMPKNLKESLYEAVLWCRLFSNTRFKMNAEYDFNQFTVSVIYMRERVVEFYAYIHDKVNKHHTYQYCLYYGAGHWKLLNSPYTDND